MAAAAAETAWRRETVDTHHRSEVRVPKEDRVRQINGFKKASSDERRRMTLQAGKRWTRTDSRRRLLQASLSVPDLSKLGKARQMYRTCTQTWFRQSLLLQACHCVFGTWWLCVSKGARSAPDKLAWFLAVEDAGLQVWLSTSVSFHNFKSQNFKLSVSNPKSKYVAYLSALSQISNCQGLGRKNKHEILKTDRGPSSRPSTSSGRCRDWNQIAQMARAAAGVTAAIQKFGALYLSCVQKLNSNLVF